jgi:tetratricopeptide (TPR) repeat protein
MPQPKNSPLTLPGANIAETVQRYRGRLQENPDDAGAWDNLGKILKSLGHNNAALACLNRALELTPNSPSLLSARGVLLSAMDRLEEAVDSHAAAHAAKPDDFTIRYNYAITLCEAGRLKEAVAHFKALCDLQPKNSVLKWDYSITCLHAGLFKEGWEAYEARWQHHGMKKERESNQPRWKGEDLTGKTVLIYEEQGFGDTILCTRYIPMVKARGGNIIFECKRNLHRLFQAIPGIDKIVDPGFPDGSFDYQIPLMSLPGIFGTGFDSIPPVVPMHVPELPPASARLLELGRDRFRVGVVWSGSDSFLRNHQRAVHARRFLPLAEIPGVQLYSLQKGPHEKELAECGGRSLIWELGPHLNDFADTAAVLKKLDLVIMTDSSVAHLSGTLGCPVWNLLSYYNYWLYLTVREDSPWYPSMRLLRQPDPGNWDALFKKTSAELKKAVALKKSGKWGAAA